MIRAISAAMMLATAGGAAVAQTPANEVWQSMSVEQARGLVEDTGGKVESLTDTEEGDYVMTARYPDDLPIKLKGLDCRGVGEAKTCPRFELSAYFRLDDGAEAGRLERRLAVNWLSDQAAEEYLDLWRMDSLEGGVTRAHMKYRFQTFVEAVWAAQEIVYPPKRGATGDDETS